MNSNQRPTTITASEFVAGDYAAKIARGDCVVKFGVGDVVDININERTIMGTHDNNCALWASDKFSVSWLPQPATSEQEAEIARLREALKTIADMARDAQGEWASVDPVYQPEYIHPFSNIEDVATKAIGLSSEPDHR